MNEPGLKLVNEVNTKFYDIFKSQNSLFVTKIL